MASYNIGPKIGIEGEAEFRKQIARINKEYKSMADYTAAVTKSMDANGKSQDLLASKANGLRQQIDLQQQKFEELYKALNKAKDKYGENSSEVMRYEGALLDVRNVTAALERELSETEDELDKMARGIDDVADAAEGADEKMLDFGDALKAGIASGAILNAAEEIAEAVVEIGKAAVEAASDVRAENAQFAQTFGELEGAARSALEGISADTKIATTRLQSAYTSLYAFTKSVGGDSATALDIAQRAMNAAADSAAYYDRSIEDATETLQSFLKGNYENDAALGIAATETTRNAKANELYAKSFKDLTEAQKVDTLLAMVEAGNAASGALGQAAREADAWTNVTGELAEAWRQLLAQLGGPVLDGLTPLIQGITEALKGLTSAAQWQTLNDGIATFEQNLSGAQAALETTTTELDASASIAQRYVSRLQELEASGLRTAEAQQEYALTVDLLNDLMPDLDLAINNVTGRVDQNTASIADNIVALTEQGKAQAQQEYYADILAELNSIQKEEIATAARLIELRTKEQTLLDSGAQVFENYTAAELGAAGASAELSSTMTAADRELMEVRAEIAASEGALAEYRSSIDGVRQTLDAAQQATAGMAVITGEFASTVAEVPPEVTALEEAYSDTLTAARESIDHQIGLFTKLSDESEMSAEEIVKNWDNQREAFSNYSDNLQKAIDMGLDETLVQQLSDGSQQSMRILDELVNNADVDVGEINTAFGGLSEAKDTAANAMAAVQTELDEAFQSMRQSAEAVGYDIVDGMVQQMYAGGKRVYNAGAYLGNQGIRGNRDAIQSHSPSRAYMDIADDSVDGLVLQTERRAADYARSMADLANSGMAGLQAQLDAAADFPSAVTAAGDYRTTTTTNNSLSLGGVSLTINQQPGEDPNALADRVISRLNDLVRQYGGALG